MFSHKPIAFLFTAVIVVGSARIAMGQCTPIDFEDLATGTIVTHQYEGVTFSVEPQSCNNNPPIYLRIAQPAGGCSSGAKALMIDTGCPDFSPDYMIMTFDDPQGEVSFNAGIGPGNFTVRAYDTASGGVPIITETVELIWGVHRFVRLTSPDNDILRVEIESFIGNYEAIDDLVFGLDDTSPTALITSPYPDSIVETDACVCDPVYVTGIACDFDGAYGMDKLEYKPEGGDEWTLIGSYTTPLCTEGTLYAWDTSGPEITEGFYYLRLTVENACGLTETAMSTVFVDKHYSLEDADFREPDTGDILGGTTCFDGTVWDRCYDTYTVEYRPALSGTFEPVDPSNPVYETRVVNDPFAFWNTTLVDDGKFEVLLTATDLCGNSQELSRTVFVDNTPPTALIDWPLPCDHVEGEVAVMGTADDENLDQWYLQYTGGTASGWVTIASGTNPVVDGLLATWDTDGLPACAYTLRLVVYDDVSIDCGDPLANPRHVTDMVSVNVGTETLFDADGDGDVDLIDYGEFQDAFTGPL